MEIIIGMVVTLVAGLVKQYAGTNKMARIGMVLAIAFVFSALYTTFIDTPVWESFMKVAMTAGSFYVFIWKHVEEMFV